ncbi:aldolase [Salipaludibacillus keqinensis]|uniref:Aldolase n=1 Tax=Salipaludibacillus keqinensis TaxID=2045207 RepID=A0A323TYK9_9BACI|nr:aldolase [Salipaludibacillus keqinensis]PYZ94645.1 aldolase [Salipaludibacillus keqinensis]
MIETVKTTVYKAFGLNLSSVYSLPELVQCNTENINIDVKIHKSELDEVWQEQALSTQMAVIKEHSIMVMIPNVAIFLIENGKDIRVSPFTGAKEDQIRLYLLGTCMGAILMQRKILPLHGSAIVIEGKVYVLVGESGAGKSTLASAFLQKGFKLVSDDVIPVIFSEDGIPLVIPAYPQQKLWQESLDSFGIDSSDLKPIIDRETKYAVPVKSMFSNEILPLAGVFELTTTKENEIQITIVEGLQRFPTLYQHTYRQFFLEQAGLMKWHFQTSVKLLNKLKVYQLKRPVNRFTANELTSLILSTISKGEKTC